MSRLSEVISLEASKAKPIAGQVPDAATGSKLRPQSGAKLQEKVLAELTAPVDSKRHRFEQGACFAKGTLVHTKDGPKPIEQIQVGDWVLSKPENGGEQAYKRVVKTFAHPPQRVVSLKYLKPESKPSMTSGTVNRIIVTLNHPFWTKEEGWTAPSHMQHNGMGAFHFEDKDGHSVKFWAVQDIYFADQPNVGWTSNRWPESMRGYGSLWDYDEHRLVAPEAYALEDISWGEHPDPYFKAPVYNLEVEDFHTYYVGEHGIWVRNQNCDGWNLEVRNQLFTTAIAEKISALETAAFFEKRAAQADTARAQAAWDKVPAAEPAPQDGWPDT